MKQKTALQILFALVALYVILVIAIPHIVLPVTAAAWLVTVHGHFVDVKSAVQSDAAFFGIIAGVIVAFYYFLVYKPKIKAGRNAKPMSTGLKVVFAALLIYAALLVIIPYITSNSTVAAWITFQTHFVDVKRVIISDAGFLAIAVGLIGGLYYFSVYRPKLSKKGR